MMINRKDVLELRSQGLTYQAIAERFSTSKAIVWKMEHWGMETMEIGSKPRCATRPVFKIWKYIEPEKLYALAKNVACNEEHLDKILNWCYSRKYSFASKLEMMDTIQMERYLWKVFSRL